MLKNIIFLYQNAINTFYNLYYDYWDLITNFWPDELEQLGLTLTIFWTTLVVFFYWPLKIEIVRLLSRTSLLKMTVPSFSCQSHFKSNLYLLRFSDVVN